MDDHHLRKNDNDYWLCPLCGHALIYDSDPRDIYCPKFVDVQKTSPGSGVRWNHFDIFNLDIKNHVRWVAVIPPFYVSWDQTTRHAIIKRIDPADASLTPFHEFFTDSEEEILRLYKRLNNLKVFA